MFEGLVGIGVCENCWENWLTCLSDLMPHTSNRKSWFGHRQVLPVGLLLGLHFRCSDLFIICPFISSFLLIDWFYDELTVSRICVLMCSEIKSRFL